MQPQKRSQVILAIVLLALVLGGAGLWWWSPWKKPYNPISGDVNKLLGLMKQRLGRMPQVARAKKQLGKKIADPERERQVLDNVVTPGEKMGLDPRFVETFFKAQFEASTRVQENLLEHWAKVGEPVDPVSTLEDLRRMLDEDDQQILKALPAALKALTDQRQKGQLDAFRSILTGDGIDQQVQDTAIKPLVTSSTAVQQ